MGSDAKLPGGGGIYAVYITPPSCDAFASVIPRVFFIQHQYFLLKEKRFKKETDNMEPNAP